MKVVVPQITWHSRDPVLSVDFDPTCNGEEGYYRLASGGGDCQLLVWRVTDFNSLSPELSCVTELKRHEKPVNVVRFSPDGNYIATGGDDAYIILWKCVEKTEKKESWQFEKSLRKHIEDVSDLSWSPDSKFLVSGSVDNSAILWDVKKGIAVHVWSEKEHTGFVHGVAYDPLHEFVTSMCIDRHLRFFDLKSNNSNKPVHKSLKYPEEWIKDTTVIAEEKENSMPNGNAKSESPSSNQSNPSPSTSKAAEESMGTAKKKSSIVVNRLFQDEFLPTFCRRLSFSPRGELLLVPGGMLPPGQQHSKDSLSIIDDSDDKKNSEKNGTKDKKSKKKIPNNAVIVFCRHSWTNPCAVIPTLESYSIGGRFCPVYFKRSRKPFQYEPNYTNAISTKKDRSVTCVAKIASQKEEPFPLMKMPYRLVYAVATNDSVLIGDTASPEPLAVIRSIHLARITDISWASNGRALMVSSTDGYCSLITFENGELGEEFVAEPENFPALTRDCFPVLPPEPKKEKVKKKRTPKAKKSGESKAAKEKESKTPTSNKKKPVVKSKDISTMFSAVSANLQAATKKETGISGIIAATKKEAGLIAATSTNAVASDAPSPTNQNNETENIEVKIAEDSTPKFKPQKTTLDRWFQKTPKPSETKTEKTPITPRLVGEKTTSAATVQNQTSTSAKTSNTVQKKATTGAKKSTKVQKKASTSAKKSSNATSKRPPEVILLSDDDSSEIALNSTNSKTTAAISEALTQKIYPMTPPLAAKPIAVRRLSTSTAPGSPLASSPNGSHKRKQGDITPEELYRLKTAPLKCRKLTEEPEVIMESSSSQDSTNTAQGQSQEPPVASSPKVTDPNCPSSPVSSTASAPRPPRRITLTTLAPATTQSNLGKLD